MSVTLDGLGDDRALLVPANFGSNGVEWIAQRLAYDMGMKKKMPSRFFSLSCNSLRVCTFVFALANGLVPASRDFQVCSGDMINGIY